MFAIPAHHAIQNRWFCPVCQRIQRLLPHRLRHVFSCRKNSDALSMFRFSEHEICIDRSANERFAVNQFGRLKCFSQCPHGFRNHPLIVNSTGSVFRDAASQRVQKFCDRRITPSPHCDNGYPVGQFERLVINRFEKFGRRTTRQPNNRSMPEIWIIHIIERIHHVQNRLRAVFNSQISNRNRRMKFNAIGIVFKQRNQFLNQQGAFAEQTLFVRKRGFVRRQMPPEMIADGLCCLRSNFCIGGSKK